MKKTILLSVFGFLSMGIFLLSPDSTFAQTQNYSQYNASSQAIIFQMSSQKVQLKNDGTVQADGYIYLPVANSKPACNEPGSMIYSAPDKHFFYCAANSQWKKLPFVSEIGTKTVTLPAKDCPTAPPENNNWDSGSGGSEGDR